MKPFNLFCLFIAVIFIFGVHGLAYSKEFKLENGVDVVYENTPHTQIVSVQAWINTGSVNENRKNNGISHFLEHILFKGTKNFKPDEIDEVVESHGGIMNAGTSKDYTMYYITLPAEHAEVAAKVISDMIFQASFIPEEIEKEKPVVIQEIQRKFDNPTYDMWRDASETLLNGTPYEMEIIGTEENVNSFTSEILSQYYKSHYHPENTTLVIVGDISQAEAEKLSKKYFNISFKDKASVGYDKKWKKTLIKDQAKTFRKDVSQDYALIAYQIDATAKNGYVYEVLTEILSGGEYSQLNDALKYKNQLATYAAAGESLNKNSGVYMFHIVTEPGLSDRAIKVLDDCLKSIQAGGISKEELTKAKNRLKSRTIFMQEKASSLASEYGYYYTIGQKDYHKTYNDYIDAVTINDVTNAAKEIFSSPRLVYKTVPVK